jgi:hypothetical protein
MAAMEESLSVHCHWKENRDFATCSISNRSSYYDIQFFGLHNFHDYKQSKSETCHPED